MDTTSGSTEGVEDPDPAEIAAMLEILGDEFGAAMHFCLRPEVGVEPGQAVGREPVQRRAENSLVRPQHGELAE